MTENEIRWCQLTDVPVLIWVFLVAKKKKKESVAPLQDYNLEGFRGAADEIVDKCYLEMLFSGCCQAMLPMCNQSCGRTLIKTFRSEYC